MNIINSKNKVQKTLNESQQILQSIQNNEPLTPQQQKIQEVLTSDSKKFNFENGGSMSKIDTGNAFCIPYHIEHTNNWDEFIESIQKFISIGGSELTSKDKDSLAIEYNKYYSFQK